MTNETSYKVNMDTSALKALLGKNFNSDKYEEGRKDTRAFLQKHPDKRDEKIKKVKEVLENGEYRNCPEPSYWIGCLYEFYWI